MKKLLSITLAVAMIMSLFCVVPASADVGAAPYVFYTFEDGVNAISTTTGQTTSLVDGGVNGSAKAIQIDVTRASVHNGISGMSNTEVEAGDKLTASMWVKLSEKLHADSTGTIAIIFFGKKIEGSATYKFITTKLDTQSTDWQKVTWEYTFKEDHTAETVVDEVTVGPITSFSLRMNDNGNGNNWNATLNEDGSKSLNCTYLIDDFELRIEKAGASDIKAETELAERILYTNDFSENVNSLSLMNEDTAVTGERIVEDDAAYYRLTDNSTTENAKLKIQLPEPMEAGKTYVIQHKIRASEAKLTADANGALEEPTVYDASTYIAPFMYLSSGAYARYANASSGGLVKNNDTWYTTTYYVNMPAYATNAKNVEGCDYIYLSFYAQSNNYDTAVYEIDDISIKVYDSIANGDFETKGELRLMNEQYINNSAGGSRAYTTAFQKHGYYFNWKSDNTDATTGNMIRAHKNYGTDGVNAGGSMKFTKYGSKFFTYVDVTEGNIYSLAGSIKAGDATSASKVNLGIDYTDGTNTQSVVVATVDINNEGWTTVDSAKFTVPAGMTGGKFFISPVAPDGTEADAECTLDIWSDDWHLVQHPVDGTPVVEEASASMATDTGIVTPAYTYNEIGDAAVADSSYFKLLDGDKVIASFAKSDVIVVPEAYRTSANLKLTIVPYSTTSGFFGEEVTTAISAASVIEGITLTATEADGATVVSADAIEDATLIWVAYDANGKMLSHATAPCNVTAGGTVTVAIPATFNATGAAKVKVMLWQDMLKCVPLADFDQY